MFTTPVRVAAAAALTMTVVGCGGAAEDSGGSADLVIWSDDTRGEVLEPFAEEFGETNGITVAVETHSSDDLQEDFLTASQQGEGPDVLVAAHDWIGNLVQNGTIDPVRLSEDQSAGLDPLALQAVTYDGKVYGAPYARENLALIRNTELAPEEPESVEDLAATGEEAVEEGDAEDILSMEVTDVGDPYHMYPFFVSGGGYLFGTDDDGEYVPEDLGLTESGAVSAFEKLGELGEKGVLKTSMNPDNSIPRFAEGKTPYLISGQWALPQVTDSGVDYEVSKIPAFEGGEDAVPFVGVQAFYVASKGDNKTMAAEFVTNYSTTPEMSQALYDAEPRIPALTEVYDSVSADDADIAAFNAAAEGGDILPAIPEMAAVWDPFGKAEAAVLEGEDPEKAIKGAADSITEAIGD